ncbi:unnamed protein product, partial [Mesorhabditis spiculigera]
MSAHRDLPKRDFMMVKPPRTEADFHREYDSNIGLGTAFVLILFFVAITIKSCVKWMIRKVQMHNFKKARLKDVKTELL